MATTSEVTDALLLADKIEQLQDDGSEGVPWDQDELDLIIRGLRSIALVNTPEVHNFTDAVQREAAHQVERWGTAHDRAKDPADWFWLIGYLSGKALQAHVSGNTDKAKHHCISSAAALYNWHAAIAGTDSRMTPGKSDLQERIEQTFGPESS